MLKLIPVAQQTPADREALLISSGDDAQVAQYFLSGVLSGASPTQQPDAAQRRKLLSYFTQTKPFAPLEPLFGLFEYHAAESVLEQILAARFKPAVPRYATSPSEHHWLLSRYAATQRREQAFELAWNGLPRNGQSRMGAPGAVRQPGLAQ